MLNTLKLILLLVLSLSLASCSSSSKNKRQVSLQLQDEVTSGRLFVVRNTGSPGILNKISVIHNGKNVGDIGMKETSVSNSVEGVNYLTASMNGLAGISTRDAPILTYDSTLGQNRFFVIRLLLKSNGADLYLVEVNERQFKSVALNSSWMDYL